MCTNKFEFNGNVVFIQFNINSTEPTPKKDALGFINKVMPYVLTIIKWVIKFLPLIIPLHSG